MRARNLKPGFFKNEQLAELPYECRLLFAGLWCVADREGRLEDRPRRIKMELFPGDSCDVDDMLNQLHRHGLIVRYEERASPVHRGVKLPQTPAPAPERTPILDTKARCKHRIRYRWDTARVQL